MKTYYGLSICVNVEIHLLCSFILSQLHILKVLYFNHFSHLLQIPKFHFNKFLSIVSKHGRDIHTVNIYYHLLVLYTGDF